MKVYVAVYIPHGELRYEDSVNVIGVFNTRKEAVLKAYEEEIEYFITKENYVINLEETDNFINGKSDSLSVFQSEYENYNCYYEIAIYEREVI